MAWLAAGLPGDGLMGDHRRAGSRMHEGVPRLGPETRVSTLPGLIGGWDVAAVVDPDGCLLGAVRAELAEARLDVTIAAVMDTAPPTVRPSIPVEDLAKSMAGKGLDRVFVTTPDGRLLGLVRPEDLHGAN